MDDARLDSGEFDRAPGDVLQATVLAGQFLIGTERLIVAVSAGHRRGGRGRAAVLALTARPVARPHELFTC